MAVTEAKRGYPRTRAQCWEVEVALACGQFLLRRVVDVEAPEPLLLRPLCTDDPGLVARLVDMEAKAVRAAFEAETPPVHRIEAMALRALATLQESGCALFSEASIHPQDTRGGCLFAVLAAGRVLESRPPSVPLRALLRLWRLPTLQWPLEAHRLCGYAQGGTAPLVRLPLAQGQTLLDLEFALAARTLSLFGLAELPVLGPATTPKPAHSTPPRAPEPRKAPELEEAPAFNLEGPEGLPDLKDLVVGPETREELEYVLALLADHDVSPPPRLLFHGPPGTGKTHAARALAGELGLPLAVATPGSLINKWVGDSEKALERAFHEAADQGAVLLLDEADSFLFDRRNALQIHQVTQVNALLGQLDRTRAPVVLCTNFLRSLDEAVHRRVDHMIEFPIPPEPQRRLLWARELEGAEGAGAMDLDRLARLPLTGGLIHNACTQALRRRRVRGEGYPLTTQALLALAGRELPKMGELSRGRSPVGFSAPAPEGAAAGPMPTDILEE